MGVQITTVTLENVNCAPKDSSVICEFDLSAVEGTTTRYVGGVPKVVPYRQNARKGNAIMRKGDKGWF